MVINIYTDGACRGNPGPGGWAAILSYKNKIKQIYGAETYTTNNRMELTAAIKALEILQKPSVVHLYTDSQYLRLGVSVWILNWKKNNWLNSQKKPVKNVDLWQILDKLNLIHTIQWFWVKAHNNHPQNELADFLANKAIDELLTQKLSE